MGVVAKKNKFHQVSIWVHAPFFGYRMGAPGRANPTIYIYKHNKALAELDNHQPHQPTIMYQLYPLTSP